MNSRTRKLAFGATALIALVIALATRTPSIRASANHTNIDCSQGKSLCTEVHDSEEVFGKNVYVGHDEPSVLFYSSTAGSGSAMTYNLTLPGDPSAGTTDPRLNGKSFNFQLHPAFWFGMAVCDDQSYPESQSTYANSGGGTACTPGSDANIFNGTSPTSSNFLGRHPGTAFMEMQFYPPGWALWPPGVSCDATKWCAALNIDSLSEDPVTGQTLNSTCAAVTGLEYVNFAFITHDGVPVGPPNPVDATSQTFDPTANNPHHSDVSFFNSGDQLSVALHDTANGLRIDINDLTHPSQGGFMVASAANNFGMVQFAPTGTTCNNIPYNFHPMYSTSSEATRVIWAAHSYNIAFSDEIGHFDYCGNVLPNGGCAKSEGVAGDIEPSDKDDRFCFPATLSSAVLTSGCIQTNSGFDGMSYQNVWPDGNAKHPQPIAFTSPVLGSGANYDRIAFEADLPRIEAKDVSPYNNCDRTTGTGCLNPPNTDDGAPAAFYPFFSTSSTASAGGGCVGWILGNDIPFNATNNTPFYTLNDFGKNFQFGPLYQSTYLVFGGSGATTARFNNFHNGLSGNPCPSP